MTCHHGRSDWTSCTQQGGLSNLKKYFLNSQYLFEIQNN